MLLEAWSLGAARVRFAKRRSVAHAPGSGGMEETTAPCGAIGFVSQNSERWASVSRPGELESFRHFCSNSRVADENKEIGRFRA